MSKKYYNGETEKALENFSVTPQKVNPFVIKALVLVKKTSIQTNFELKKISSGIYKSVIRAIDEILEGKFADQFVTGNIQGGAGTSINMNVNEVIAGRATEIIKGKVKVDPLEHVNLSQSTNDTLPTALRLYCLWKIDEYIKTLDLLSDTFTNKSIEFEGIMKVGRTHIQDAVPIALSQEFNAYSSFAKRDSERLKEFKKYLLLTNLGGTAIGTGVNAGKKYIKLVNENLAKNTGYKFQPSPDLIDATQNVDNFLHISSLLALSASGLSKICSDIRLLSSGPRAGIGELKLPELQKGSSIMPGKNNPVIFEMLNQIANLVIGNNNACTIATLSGQLELNVMLPTFIKTLPESFDFLIKGVNKLTEVVGKIEADKERCEELLQKSFVYSTELSKHIGYEKTAEIVKKALNNKTTLNEELNKSESITDETKLQWFE